MCVGRGGGSQQDKIAQTLLQLLEHMVQIRCQLLTGTKKMHHMWCHVPVTVGRSMRPNSRELYLE